MEEPNIPELTGEQIELLCNAAELAARKFVFSRVPKKIVEKLNIDIEAEGTEPLSLSVEVDIELKTGSERGDLQLLASNATKEAFKASENFLRTLRP